MRLALEQAALAAEADEVPVGAVVVCDGRVVASARNTREGACDPSGHAEFTAMLEAARHLGRWRLSDCTVYVTLEPCPMCAGLMVQSRLGRCVYGAPDPKAGALGSLYSFHEDARLNHAVEVDSGVLADDCAQLLTGYFEGKRRASRDRRHAERAAKPRSVRATAPAKVNLALAVGAPDERGYHPVDTLMQALQLSDELDVTFEPADPTLPVAGAADGEPDGEPAGEPTGVEVELETVFAPGLTPFDIPQEKNLVVKAARAFFGRVASDAAGRLTMRLSKRIPDQAGLGGGSSDAAAALVALAEVFPAEREVLVEIAQGLGADVAFFLEGGAALMTGYGDVLVRTLEVPDDRRVMLVRPDAGVSTPKAYAAFDALLECDPEAGCSAEMDACLAAYEAGEVCCANALEAASASIVEGLGEVADLLRATADDHGLDAEVVLCGSGSCWALIPKADQSRAAVARAFDVLEAEAERLGWWSCATRLSPRGVKAKVL